MRAETDTSTHDLFARAARTSSRATLVFGAIALAIGGGIVGGTLGSVPGGLVGAALAALGVFWIVSGVRGLRAPWTDPAYEDFGPPGPQRLAAAQALEQELAAPDTHVFGTGDRRVFVSRTSLVSVADVVKVVPLDKVLWCYPQTKTYSVNFLPVGEVSSFVLYTSEGYHAQAPIQLPVLPAVVVTDSLLEVLAARAPAAFIGYRPEWATQWNAVRASVLDAFAKRRSQHTRTSNGEGALAPSGERSTD